MIEINSSLYLEDSEVQYIFIRASGPGGQNVNKVATSVQLRFDIRKSPSLDAEVKERLIKLAGKRITDEGILLIEAKRFRTQDQNRTDANARLVNLIKHAIEIPKNRISTKPTKTSKIKRVQNKIRHGQIKRLRQNPSEDN